MSTLYAGIDIGAQKNAVQFMSEAGEALTRLSVPNDVEGTERLVDALLESAGTTATSIRVGMEATGLYWWHLHHALTEEPRLAAFDLQVAVINPKVVAGFRKIYPDLPKTDAIDAWVIADCLRFGRIRLSPPPDPRYAPLQRLTRFRYHLAQNLTREKNRALALLFLRFSSYGKETPFSNVFGKASQAVLTELTVGEVANASLEDLARLILQNGNNRLVDPEAMAAQLKRAARNAFRLHPKMDDAVGVTLSMSLATIRFFENQLADIDKVIATELKAISQTLDTVPGLGPVYTAGLIAEIGDITRFPDHNALAKYAGLTWRERQSGAFTAEDLPLTRSGNFYLRYYLVEAANSVRVREPEYAAFYERKVREASHHRHKRALVLTARKLVRLVFALLNDGQIYRRQAAH